MWRAEEVRKEEGGEHDGESGTGVARDGACCHAKEDGAAGGGDGNVC